MGFFSKILGKSKSLESFQSQAEDFLQNIESLLKHDVKGAKKLIEKKAKEFDAVIREGGDLHDRFVKAAYFLISKERTRIGMENGQNNNKAITFNARSLLNMTRNVGWYEVEELKDLISISQSTMAKIIWVGLSDPELNGDMFSRLKVLYEFTVDPKLVFACLNNGVPMIIRRSFLMTSVWGLDLQTELEDLKYELIDIAKRHNLRWRFF